MKDCKTLLKLYEFTHFVRLFFVFFFKRGKITWGFFFFFFFLLVTKANNLLRVQSA